MEELNIRNSKKRKAIIDYLTNNYSHPTAEKIYEDLKVNIKDLSLGTVYRNLKLLENIGEVKAIQIENNICHYELTKQKHIHFVCKKCNDIIDLNDIDEKQLSNFSLKYKDYLISDMSLTLYGLCPKCKKE